MLPLYYAKVNSVILTYLRFFWYLLKFIIVTQATDVSARPAIDILQALVPLILRIYRTHILNSLQKTESGLVYAKINSIHQSTFHQPVPYTDMNSYLKLMAAASSTAREASAAATGKSSSTAGETTSAREASAAMWASIMLRRYMRHPPA